MSESITCRVCGRTSFHPQDVKEGWCNACGGATAHDPPAGLVWVLFVGGGQLDRSGRLVDDRRLEVGMTYEVIPTGDVYRYDGEHFALSAIPAESP